MYSVSKKSGCNEKKNLFFRIRKGDMKIYNMNVSSLLAHHEEIESKLCELKPQMLMLCETCITEEISDGEVKYLGYNTIRCDSFSRHTGGVAIILRENITYTVVSREVFNENNAWFLTIKIKKGMKKGVYTVLYHSPSQSDSKFLDFFENYCRKNQAETQFIYMFGDFNIDVSLDSTYSNRLRNIINENCLKQLVSDYTRISPCSKTLIDLILSNDVFLPVGIAENFKVSDHETLVARLQINKVEENVTIVTSRSTVNYSESKLNECLGKLDWTVHSEDVEEKADRFLNNMTVAINELAPIRQRVFKNTCKWYSKELESLRRERDVLYKTFRLNDDVSTWERYKLVRNKYNKIIKLQKNKYIKDSIEKHKYDCKKMWKSIKDIVRGQSTNKVNAVEFPDKVEDDRVNIARKFNEYFLDSINVIR
jgi:exonuclease III